MASEIREYPYDFKVMKANLAKHLAEFGDTQIGALEALQFAETPLTDEDKAWLAGANSMQRHPTKPNRVLLFKETRQ